ncbi:MAG: hypothetical protein AABY22_30375 [Nanoarchaeota archaeon]
MSNDDGLKIINDNLQKISALSDVHIKRLDKFLARDVETTEEYLDEYKNILSEGALLNSMLTITLFRRN